MELQKFWPGLNCDLVISVFGWFLKNAFYIYISSTMGFNFIYYLKILILLSPLQVLQVEIKKGNWKQSAHLSMA